MWGPNGELLQGKTWCCPGCKKCEIENKRRAKAYEKIDNRSSISIYSNQTSVAEAKEVNKIATETKEPQTPKTEHKKSSQLLTPITSSKKKS